MTEQELASKFTLPDDKLLALRMVILRVLEDRIREVNQNIRDADTSHKMRDLTNYRSGISWAAATVRNLIDGQGKIMKSDLTDQTWPMADARLIELLLGEQGEQK